MHNDCLHELGLDLMVAAATVDTTDMDASTEWFRSCGDVLRAIKDPSARQDQATAFSYCIARRIAAQQQQVPKIEAIRTVLCLLMLYEL